MLTINRNRISVLKLCKKCNFKPIFGNLSLGKYYDKKFSEELKKLTKNNFDDIYHKAKEKFYSKKLPYNVNEDGVFACNELDLKEVEIYGFDYDYTLAFYKASLDVLLYNLGREIIVENLKYPKEIKNLEYIPKFAVRGLHYDIEHGLLLKLDIFLQIQLESVYRGLTRVPKSEVLKLYQNHTLPASYVDGQSHSDDKKRHYKPNMVQLADLFSLPEMGLLCNITEYFVKNKFDYHPAILFNDVKKSVQSSHPIMHQEVLKDPAKYIEQNPRLVKYLQRLVDHGKKLFLVTNSPFYFVNSGMTLLVGSDWRKYFEVVIVRAKKPLFFTRFSTPLHEFNVETNSHLWDRVTKLQKGKIYYEGSVKHLQDLTGWRGRSVLYFGDHPYSDLADVTLKHGWRTGAIIHELTHEIKTLNDESFKKNINWLQMLTMLIEDYQDVETEASKTALEEWKEECYKLRVLNKNVFNEQFGSVFRTYHNPSYFSRRLFRFADIYTSNLTNLLDYGPNHTFYPRRGVMPHEYSSYFM